MTDAIYQMLGELNAAAPHVRHAYDDLFDPDLNTVPIPFFGDLSTASVLTVGLNPSDGEIRGRGWPRPVETSTLFERLTRYFDTPHLPPHPWFETWTVALRQLDLSYSEATAAHVDVCPWPTRPMSSQADPNRFAALISESVPWFERCIQLAPNLKLLLMAGAVTNRYYLNEFVQKTLATGEMTLVGKVTRGGTAFVGYQQLCTSARNVPLFFCSVSPSFRKRDLLPTRVSENRERLLAFLTKSPPPN